MESRGHWRARCWRAAGSAALLLSLAIPQLPPARPLMAAAAPAASTARPEISTYAGQPAAGAPKEVAQQPFGLAVFGRYTFVADPTNHVVRLLIDNGEVAFAGAGGLAVKGDGLDPAKAQLAGPYAVAIGKVKMVGYDVSAFDVYIADTFGHQIRKVSVTVPPVGSPGGTQTALISTVAGTGAFGYSGDNAPATAATLDSPYGVAWDKSQNLVYIADTLNNCVRSVGFTPTGSPGNISTAVGPCSPPGTNIKTPLNHPRGLASDGNGKLYIADTYNNVVRVYDSGTEYDTPHPPSLTVLAGTMGTASYRDGVLAKSAFLKMPSAVAIGEKGNVFIADTGNNAIREVTVDDGMIHTVAGTTQRGDPRDTETGPAILAKLNAPMGVAARSNGEVVIADTGDNLVRTVEGTLTSGPVHNLHVEAGNGTPSLSGDGQPAALAQFAGPAAIVSQLAQAETSPSTAAVPAVAGQRFVVDTFNNAVRTFHTSDTDPTNHSTGDNDPDEVGTLAAGLAYPMGAALDARHNVLYVSDTFHNKVRAIDLATHAVTVIAGTGQATYDGDGGSATQESLSYPTGLALDEAGNLFIADTYNSRIREVVGGRMYTVAGTGTVGFSGENGAATAADLYFPYGVAVGSSASSKLPDLYITDSFNHRIRKVAAVSPTDHSSGNNTITTVAGVADPAFADGSAGQARFNRPWSAAVDQGGALVVADFLNHRLRRVDTAAGTVTTIAGKGTAGLIGDVGPADVAELDGPRAVSLLRDSGAMLVADSFNNRLRWFGLPQAGIQRTQVNFEQTNLAGQSQPQSVTVTSTGSGLLTMGNVDLGADRNNFYLDPQKNTCVQARLEPGASCFFQVAFQPQALGGHTGSVVIPNDAIGGPQFIVLTGQATASLVGLSPPAVAIYQPVNGPPASAAVTLTNNGDGLLTINSIALEKGEHSNFSQSNTCPSAMQGHSSCQITITLNQIGSNDRTARTDRLVVKDDAAGNSLSGGTTQFVPVSGSLAMPMASFNHQSLTFAQNLGTASGAEAFTLVNSGQTPLHLSGIHEDGDFSQTNNCPPVLAPGASCTINVTFIPSTLGERDGYIVIADDSVDSPHRIQVMGVGTMALVQLGPDRLSFTQTVGAVSAPQTVTLTNHGDGPLTIGGIAATGDFTVQSHCPPVLLPGTSCSIGVAFAPRAAGTRTGSLIVSDDAGAVPGSQQSMRLTGVADQPAVSLSATTLSPTANVGGSTSTSVTVTNMGDGALTVRGIGISGAASGDYSQSNNCIRAIQPGGACSISVSFTPHGYGVRAATLTLYDDGPGGSQSVALRGTGASPRPVLSSGYLNFGGDRVGNPTVPQSVVLFNSGNGALAITNISLSGSDFQMTTDCGITLAAGASCRISVTFVPRVTGARSGVVTILDSAGAQRFTLSGVGT